MSESESDALPLGDAPIFSFCLDDLHIISKAFLFVKSFFEKNQKNSFFSLFHILLSPIKADIIQKIQKMRRRNLNFS